MEKEQKTLSFQVISRYRALLMGLAILSIMFFHYTEDCVTGGYNLKPFITYYKLYIGSSGVDIFLFLSGFGLYYSYKKKPDRSTFYRKRFVKILIPYFLVAIPAWAVADFVLSHVGMVQFVKDLLFISFFESGDRWFWYILLILLCYMIYPYVFDAIDSSDSMRSFVDIFVLVTVIAMMFKMGNEPVFKNIEIGLLRIPAFFLGSCIGKASYENRKIPKESIAVVVLSVLLMLIARSSKAILYRYTLGLFGIVAFVSIAIALELLGRRNLRIPGLRRALEWFGKYTLELYLVHVAVRRIMNRMGYGTYRIRYECLLVGVLIVVSIILKKLSDAIISHMRR